MNRRETVSLFKFPIKSLMIPFELNWPVSLITIYILYVTLAMNSMVITGIKAQPQFIRDQDECVSSSVSQQCMLCSEWVPSERESD